MNLLLFAGFLSVCVVVSIRTRKLTIAAGLTGALLASLIFWGLGWMGIALLGTFFVLGTAATSWKKRTKQTLQLTQEPSTGRRPGQVLANGGAGGLLAALAIVFPQHHLLFLYVAAAAFSSATADTISSELGSVYGQRFYDILSFKKGERGLDGIISAEGTLLGIAGSILVATVYAVSQGWNLNFLWIVLAGTAGNLADSYLGATLERKGIIGNDVVNFANTVAAVAVALLLKMG